MWGDSKLKVSEVKFPHQQVCALCKFSSFSESQQIWNN